MGSRGPAGKPVEALKLHGTFRKHRHQEKADAPQAAGVPVKPKSMTGTGSKLWDAVVPELTQLGYVKQIDTTALIVVCNSWHLLSAVDAKLLKTPFDAKLARLRRGYFDQYTQATGRIGLTPADRMRLFGGMSVAQPKKENKVPSISEFARKRG